jgi:hypothetical protein
MLDNPKATLNSLNQFANPLALLAHQKALECVTLSHGFRWPIVIMIS